MDHNRRRYQLNESTKDIFQLLVIYLVCPPKDLNVANVSYKYTVFTNAFI